MGRITYLVVSIIAINLEHLITWTLGSELRPGLRNTCNRRYFPKDPTFRSIVAWRAGALVESNSRLTSRQLEVVKRRVEAVPRESLRSNPHVIAHLTDIVNKRARRK
jgi:hypothetical protein